MILFFSPSAKRPIGGIKQIYRHAQILSEAGLHARVLHAKAGQRCRWFSSTASLAHLDEHWMVRVGRAATHRLRSVGPPPELRINPGRRIGLEGADGSIQPYTTTEQDIVVLPEFFGCGLNGAVTRLRQVIFNQNAHGTFSRCGMQKESGSSVYAQSNTLGTVTVSEHNREYLQFAFPSARVLRVRNGVDGTLFAPRPKKELRIAFMPRKLPKHLEQVIRLLASRGRLAGWQLAPIDGASERQVADELGRALVYLSTCESEGFGLPPVEAGMCGCVVVGYSGIAAREYLQPHLSFPVPQGDVLAFAQELERVLSWCETHPVDAEAKGRQFSEYLNCEYSLERERQSVLAAWRDLLGGELSPER